MPKVRGYSVPSTKITTVLIEIMMFYLEILLIDTPTLGFPQT